MRQTFPDGALLDFGVVDCNLGILYNQMIDNANGGTFSSVASVFLISVSKNGDFLVRESLE